MANWARAFDELGTGLLRQADIGNKAYEGAMAKEAEMRAANRALRAEERANREWERREGIAADTAETVAKDLLAGKQVMQEDLITAEKERLTIEIQARKDAADKLHERQKEDAKLLATSKAEKDRIDRLMDRAKTEAKTFETLATAYAKSDDEAHRGRLETELMLSVDRMEAAYKQAGLPKLSIEENLNEIKYRLIVPQVIFNVNSNVPRDKLQTVYKAFRDNDPESSVYKNALETLDRYVQEAIDKGMVPEYRSKTRTKTELTKRVVDYMSKNYAKELTEGEGKVVDGGNGNLKKEFYGESQKDIVDQIDVDNISKDDIGLYQREFTKYQDHGHPQLQAARVRDPSVLLPLLRKERANMIGEKEAAAGYGMPWTEDKIKRLAKVEQIIAKLEALDPSLIDRYERDQFGNILRDKTPGVPSAALPAPQSDMQVAGIVNQPGMIFEADRISMASPDVNSRWAIPRRTP